MRRKASFLPKKNITGLAIMAGTQSPETKK
jgi:hypothetical protein